MPYPLPLTRTEAYLAYKAGVIQQSDLKPSLAVPRNGIDAWLAYWTGLAADYPKREDGTPHILQEEEAYIAYLCGVINEYPEKCLHRVGAYLRYLISARWGRPDHPLNREELYLSLIKTQFIPSGDPSSDIVIDGTAKAPFVDVKMYGDTFQQTYTGKNLCDYTAATYPYSGNGITAELNDDGSITVTGLPTKDYIVIVLQDITDIIEDGAIYTISCDNYGADFYLDIVGVKPGGGFGYPANTRNGSASFTVDKTTFASYQVRIETYTRASWGEESKTVTRKFQLEKGSTASSFEPFVGGTASPNPDYPQPIQTVTGLQTVEIIGKNLFDGVTTHQLILSDGTISNNGNWNLSGFIKVEPNTTYTVSFNLGSGGSHSVLVSGFDSNKVFLTRNGSQSSAPYTFTTSSTTEYIRLNYNNTNNDTDFQLEAGSTASSFVPYSHQTLPLDLGTIELCKLGTYQDYIWKDGDSWKVHKATGYEKKIVYLVGVDGYASVYGTATTSNGVFSIFSTNWGSDYATTAGIAIASSVIGVYQSQNIDGNNTANSMVDGTFCQRSGTNDRVYFRFASWARSKTVNEVYQMVTDNGGVDLWYPLTTPTDTTITDTTLIAQLEALVKGGAEEGTTYIKVSATDPNLPAKLYVEAPKYE